MLVVSDASPLNIMVRIGAADILPRLFRLVVIPPAVAEGLIDLDSSFARLKDTDFYVSHELLDQALERHRNRMARAQDKSADPEVSG